MFGRVTTAIFLILIATCGAAYAQADEETTRFVEIEGLISDNLLDRAISAIETFMQDFPNSPNLELLMYKRAELLYRTDRFDEAVTALREYISGHPASPNLNQARFLLASAFRINGDFSAAKNELGVLLRERQLDQQLKIATLERRADIHRQLAEMESAKNDLEELVKLESTPARELKLADVFYELGELRAAERRYRPLVAETTFKPEERRRIIHRLGIVLYERNNYDGVVELIKPLQQEFAADDAIITTYAWALYQQKKYQEAFEVFTSRPVAKNEALAEAVREGRSLLMVHEYSAAIAYFTRLLEDNRGTEGLEPAYRALADSYFALGDLTSGLNVLKQLAEVTPRDEDKYAVWVEIGEMYLEQLAINSEATAAFRKALSYDPRGESSDVVSAKLIRSLVEQGKLAEASTQIIGFLNDFPDSAYTEEILFLAGQIYEKGNDPLRALEHYRKIAQYRGESPYRAKSYLAALDLVEQMRRWEDVVAIGTEYTREFPKAEDLGVVYLKVARAKYQMESFNDGIVLLESALATESPDVRESATLLEIAWGYYKLGEFDQAVLFYRRVADNFADEKEAEEAYYWLGWLAQVSGDTATANENFKTLLNKFPSTAYGEIALWQMAGNYLREEAFADAVSNLKLMLERYPDGQYAELAQQRLVDAYVNLGNFREALDSIQVFTDADPSRDVNPANLLARGNQLAESGNLKAALEVFQRLLEKFPASEAADDATLNIGIIYHRLGRNRRAIEELRKLPQFFPDSDKLVQSAYYMAQSLMKLKRYEEAIEQFNVVVRARGDVAGAEVIYYMIGSCYQRLGRDAEAAAAFRNYTSRTEAVDAMPQRFLEIAGLFIRTGYYQDSVALLEKLAALPDRNVAVQAQYTLGTAFEAQGDLNRAAVEYLKVTYAHSASPVGALMARLKAGQLYEKLGMYPEAINVYQKIVENHANSKFGEVAAVRIQTLQAKLAGSAEPDTREEQKQNP